MNKLYIAIAIILLVVAGVVVALISDEDQKAKPTIQYSQPIGPAQNEKGILNSSTLPGIPLRGVSE